MWPRVHPRRIHIAAVERFFPKSRASAGSEVARRAVSGSFISWIQTS
ncbi:MAG: hypothetical protein RLZZ188_675 [Verrucomicrobiota bacterium]